jgi:hypothetical protein
MATPEASPAKKAERKKPVRKSPVLKDYPNRLAWLKAMTAYEETLAVVTDKAKVARLDKRIKVKKAAIDKVSKELAELEKQRAALVPVKAEDDSPVRAVS